MNINFIKALIACLAINNALGVNAVGKILFATDSSHSGGNLGGITGADDSCQRHAAAMSLSGTYKAMLVDGVNRVACTSNDCTSGGLSEHIDWVLAPNTQYVRTDGTTIIGTTNSNGIFPLYASGSLVNSIGKDVSVFTGINAGANNDWTTGATCSNWTSNATTDNANFGWGKALKYQFYSFRSDKVCYASFSIYCAQQ